MPGKQYSGVDVCFGLIYEPLAGLGRDALDVVRARKHQRLDLAVLEMIDDQEPKLLARPSDRPSFEQLYYSRSPSARGSAPAGFEADARRPIGRVVSAVNGQERMK